LGFEVDYDRIIFSAAFRSLQEKPGYSTIQNRFCTPRLTHSLGFGCGTFFRKIGWKKIIENIRI
jgi:dGTPase